jgi:chitosanase
MSITPTQAGTIRAIVNLFETGHVLGDYGQVTVIAGDTGHLTFGRSQTTLGSGNLHGLIAAYCGTPRARFGARLVPWLPRLEARDTALDHDRVLHNVFRATADDPCMRETQDAFFDEQYFQPAMRTAERFGISEPLGRAVVYDSRVHGAWDLVRRRVPGTPATRGERAWVEDYVSARRAWLAGHSRVDLRRTVYRMDALARLIELGVWMLDLPLVVRGAEISAVTLAGTPPGCYDGPPPGSRALAVQPGVPLSRGLDVRLVQLALADGGASLVADGVYGRASADAVAAHQRGRGLPATGVADVPLIAELTIAV